MARRFEKAIVLSTDFARKIAWGRSQPPTLQARVPSWLIDTLRWHGVTKRLQSFLSGALIDMTPPKGHKLAHQKLTEEVSDERQPVCGI
jgi:hypothetical protein